MPTLDDDERRRIAAYEAPAAVGVPAATVRSWARRGRIYAVAIDPQGRPLYLTADLTRLRDRPGLGPRRPPHLTSHDT